MKKRNEELKNIFIIFIVVVFSAGTGTVLFAVFRSFTSRTSPLRAIDRWTSTASCTGCG